MNGSIITATIASAGAIILYASDEVLEKLRIFISTPVRDNYIKTASAMRKHLWNNKTVLKTIEEIE